MTAQTTPNAGPERPDHVSELLADRLGRLRDARPGFQAELEARLLDQLPAAGRPRWRHPFAKIADRAVRPEVAARRWPLVGLATAAALILALAAGSLLAARPAQVSAAELLQRAELSAADPVAAGLKDFHLRARSAGKLPFGEGVADGAIEQWFAAPNRSRSETRSRAADGTTVLSGTVTDGERVKTYSTPGHDARTVSVMPMGIFVSLNRDEARSADSEGVPGKRVKVSEDKPVEEQAICLRGERKGETTVAGRAAYILEHEVCDEDRAPRELRGRRHVMAIDKESFLPLRVEDYDRDGKLEFKYEVTELDYDVKVPESVFTDVPPPGTVVTHEGRAPRIMTEEHQERGLGPKP